MKIQKYVPLLVILSALTVGQVVGMIIDESRDASSSMVSVPTISMPSAFELSSQFEKVSEAMDQVVVNINTETLVDLRSRMREHWRPSFEGSVDFFNRNFRNTVPQRQNIRSLGSGFVVDKNGYILTNCHVVNGADKIQVRLLSGEEYLAQIVGTDKFTDLAVIKINTRKDLVPARLGNSDRLTRGSWVLAIGSPFGLEQTVTAGIISATARPGKSPWQSFLQTDAPINHGNSGGPLVNLAAEVIGVNTAILSSSGGHTGIGFAIPSNIAIRVYNQLIEKGRVTRGAIGIRMQAEVNPQILRALGVSDGKGVIIERIAPKGGPADQSGLQQGDVIVALDGDKVSEPADLFGFLAAANPGKKVEVRYVRDGRERVTPLTVGDRFAVFNKGSSTEVGLEDSTEDIGLGLRAQEFTPRLKQQYGLTAPGLLVRGVVSGSVADEAGLRSGDILMEVNKTPVSVPRQLYLLASRLKSGMDVLFFVNRPNPAGDRLTALYLATTIP